MKDGKQPTTKATRSELVALVDSLRGQVAALEGTLRSSNGTRELLDNIQDGILVIDAATHTIREINPMAATMFGAPREQIQGHECFEFICPAQRGACPVTDLGVAVDHAERQMVTKDGGRRPILKTVARMTLGGDDVLVESFMDISEQKQAEEELRALALRHDTLLAAIPEIVMEVDNDKVYTWANQAGSEFFGEDVVGNEAADFFEGEQQVYETVEPVFKGTEGTVYVESWQRRQDGEKRLLAWWCRSLADGEGNVTGALSSAHDITERKQAEENLAAAASEWRETFDAMDDSVALLNEKGEVLRCNAATVRLTGRDYKQIVGRPCFEVLHGTKTRRAGCPQMRARRTQKNETHIFKQDGHWLRVGFQPQFDTEGGFAGGVHIVSDVTELKQVEQELQTSVGQLQSIVEQVIAAIGGIVEARDPYTSGHEQRVSQLATAIAKRMKLDDDVVTGVRVAALLHDVGKITVPSEILTKPGRLTEIEFELIKTHSQATYDVLHSIEFHWPVAAAALQHHERLDGSGYPQGLDESRIILEARILAVADVVEAMASHRPYRAALGVDLALDEIKKNRGKLYDSDVVDACVGLFRTNGGFAFQ